MQDINKHIMEILSNGENRPLFPPNVQARLENVSRRLTEVADWLDYFSKKNPSFGTTFTGYKKANEIREQVINIADIALLVSEFYELNDKFQKLNLAYINGEVQVEKESH